MSLIRQAFPIGVQILQSKSIDRFVDIKALCANEYAALEERKAHIDTTNNSAAEFLFELTLNKFLNMLLSHQAKTLQLPYQHESFMADCNLLASSKRVGLISNTMRMMRSLMSITARILIFNDLQLATNPYMVRDQSFEIILALYDFISLYQNAKDDITHGLTDDDLNDIKHCVSHFIQSETIKDHAPQTLMQEFISIVGNIFLDKLLAFRVFQLDQDKTDNNVILALDAILWRLNLNKQKSIRTILHRYITCTQLQIKNYHNDKANLDFRKISVLSILIDNTDNQIDLKGQFKIAIKNLLVNMELEFKKLYYLSLSNSKKDNDPKDTVDLKTSIVHGSQFLLFDAKLLYANLKALHLPNTQTELSMLGLIINFATSFLINNTDKSDDKESIISNFLDIKINELPLDWMANVHHSDAVSNVICTNFSIQLTKIGTEASIKQYIHDLNILLERLDKKHANKFLMQRLILNLYIYIRQYHSGLVTTFGGELANKIAKMSLDMKDHPIQNLLFKDLTGKIQKEKRPETYVQILRDLTKYSQESSALTLKILINNIVGLASSLKKSNLRTDLTIELAAKQIENYINECFLDVLGSSTYDVYYNVYYPAFDLDLITEAACPYPDEASFIIKLFTTADQIDSANSIEELLLIKDKFADREAKLKEYESEFEDIFGIDYQNSDNYHVQAFHLEKDLIMLMKVMIHRRLNSLQHKSSDDEIREYESALSKLALYKQMFDGEVINDNLDLIRVYIGLMIIFIDYVNHEFNSDNLDNWQAKTDFLLDAGYLISVLPEYFITNGYMNNIPLGLFVDFRNAFKVIHYPDCEPVSIGQKHLLNQLQPVIDKLLAIRSSFESGMSDRDKQNPNKAEHALSVRYHLGLIDMLINNYNLIRNAPIRKRYTSISKQTLSPETGESNQHLHPLGIPLLYSKNESQIEMAVKIATQNLHECLNAYHAIDLLGTNDVPAYQSLLNRICLHINFIARDCVSLLTRHVVQRNKDPVFMSKVHEMVIALSAAFYTLESINLANFMIEDSVRNLGSVYLITDHQAHESLTVATINEMNECDDLKKLQKLIEIHLKNNNYENKIRPQSLTDIYLNLLSRCESVEEYEEMLATELHARVVALPIADHQVVARDLLIKAAHPKFNLLDLSTIEINDYLSKVDDFNHKFVEAYRLFEKSKNPDAQPPVCMCSSQFIKFRHIVTSLLERIDVKDKYNFAAISVIERIYASFLSSVFPLFNPERLSTNIVNMKPVNVIKSSFAVEIQTNSQKSKLGSGKAKPKSTSKPTAREQKLDDDNKIDFLSLCKRYKYNYAEVASYYIQLLNHPSYRVRNDQSIKFKAVLGLAETITHINDESARKKFIAELVLHASFILKMQAPASPLQVFGDCYTEFKEWIEPHMPKAETKVITKRVVAKSKTQQKRPSGKLRSDQSVQTVKVDQKIEKPMPVRKLFSPFTEDVFSNFRKKITLPDLILTDNERKLIHLLHDKQAFPLISGEAVRNVIRKIPYSTIDAICFIDKADLKNILECHLGELKIKSLTEFSNQLLVKFDNESESLTVTCLNGKDKAAALYRYAISAVIGVEIFYCAITNNIIDPCRLYTRIKSKVLDTAKLFESEAKIKASFKEMPECMLTAVIEESVCRKYNVALECSALKAMIISFNFMHPNLCNKRISQQTFDNLFIKGHADYVCLHLEYDIINSIFPVFERNKHDSGLIQLACYNANARYNLWTSKEHLTLRTYDKMSDDIIFQFRIAFISDLLRAKFLSTHYLGRYVQAGKFFHHQSLRDDITIFLERCNIPFDDKMLIELEKLWAKDVESTMLLKQ